MCQIKSCAADITGFFRFYFFTAPPAMGVLHNKIKNKLKVTQPSQDEPRRLPKDLLLQRRL